MAIGLQKNTIKGMGLTATAGFICGLLPIFTNLYIQFGGDVDSFNLYGFILTVILLGTYIAITGRSLLIPKKSVVFLLIAGILFAAIRVFLTYSYQYLDVGVATTLHFMHPLFAALFGTLFFREKMPFYKWLAFVVASCSVYLFATGFDGRGQLVGIALALASAVCVALYMLTTEKAGLVRIDPIVFVFYVSAISAVACLFMGIGKGHLLTSVPWRAIAIVVVCAVVNNGIGFACQQQGVKHLGAAMAAIFSLSEPVCSCILGAVFLHQSMGLRSILGIVAILICLSFIVLMDSRTLKKK